MFSAKHRFASRSAIDVDELRQERWLRRTYCELAEKAAALIRSHSLDVDRGHELTSERDLIALIETDLGVAFAPRSSCPRTLKQAPVKGMEMRRTVYLYGVAGRERTAVASAILKLLRATDWSRQTN
jgi:DNA-binding transcriptional LysR family regulator